MVERIEITDMQSGERRVAAVSDATQYLAVSADGDIIVQDTAAGAVLCLLATRTGHRLESVTPGGQVKVGDEELFCKDLANGDEFVLGNFRLRWQAPPAVASPRARRRSEAVAPSPARTRPRSRSSSRLPVFTAITIGVAAIALVLRTCARTDWPRTPQHYVDLARTQLRGGRLPEALASIDFALREATGSTREAAEDLQRQIRGALVAAADVVAVQRARRDQDMLWGFRDRYLGSGSAPGPARPAARELVRLCDEWMQQHEPRVGSTAEAMALVAEVRAMRAAMVDRAELGSAETATDVVFAARSHLRFQVREYKAALARLDAFLQQHPDDAAVLDVRAELLRDGEPWLCDRLQMIERLLDRGDRDDARAELRQLERYALLPAWEPLAAPLAERLR